MGGHPDSAFATSRSVGSTATQWVPVRPYPALLKDQKERWDRRHETIGMGKLGA